MMFSSFIARFIHTSRNSWAAEKSLLATLRKKTGYTFSNCKKALELHNNDIAQAEKWLKEQAQAMGWSKATKLEGRQTSQGLVAVVVDKNTGAMVELNCETDFVARNKNFQEMIETAAKACLSFAGHQAAQLQTPITKIALNHEQLKNLPAQDGKKLGDHVALMIGTVGENATLRRAICFKTNPDVLLTGYTHPASNDNPDIKLGKFGALLAYKPEIKSDALDIIGRKLCQHIVGMNPLKIGSENDKPAENSDDETSLIYQDYILDESLKVKDILTENGIEIVDFKRFECGQQDGNVSAEKKEQPLEKVANAQ